MAYPWAKRALLACALLLGATGVASADVTYVYTGLAFNTAGCFEGIECAPFAPGPGPLTLSFTLPTALAPDLGTIGGALYDMTSNVATTPTSFSMSDGLVTLSGPAGGITSFFNVATDASGNIVNWKIGVGTSDLVFGMETAFFINGVVDTSVTEAFTCCQAFVTSRSISGAPGTWKLEGGAATPEPSSLLLLGTGLIAAAALRRRLLG